MAFTKDFPMRKVLNNLLLCLLCLHARSITAQELLSAQADSNSKSVGPDYTLESITITAPRSDAMPSASQTLLKKDIQATEIGFSLEESLRAVPGIFVNNRHNLSQGDRLSMRGIGSRAAFGVRGVKIILDDIPLTFADGQSQLNNLDLSSVGLVKIIRGPMSSLYGNSSGGVLQIYSESPSGTGLKLMPRVTVGVYGLRKLQSKLSYAGTSRTFIMNLSSLKSDGFREHATAKSTSLNIVSTFQLKKRTAVNAVLNFVDAPYLLNPSSLDKSTAAQNPRMTRSLVKMQGAGKKVRQLQGGISLRHEPSEQTQMKATVFGLSRSLFNPIPGLPGRIVDLDRIAGGLRSVLTHHFIFRQQTHKLTLGTDFEIMSDTRQEFENGGLPDEPGNQLSPDAILGAVQIGPRLLHQDETVWGSGSFLRLDLQLRQRLTAVLAARYDRYHFQVEDRFFGDGNDDSGTRSMQQVSPLAGLIFRPRAGISVFGNFSTGFQTPTTTELGNRPEGAGGFNPKLRPEKIKNLELGFTLDAGSMTLQTTIYQLHIDDMLIPFQLADPASEEIFYRNAARVRNRGIEFGLTWKPFSNLVVSLSHTHSSFRFQDYQAEVTVAGVPVSRQLAGNRVPGVPDDHLFLSVKYETAHGFFVKADCQLVSDYFANDFNGPPPGSSQLKSDFINDGYFLADMRSGLENRLFALNFRVFLGINNLLDARYNGSMVPNAFGARFFEPGPGRFFFTGLSLSWPAAM